MSGDAGAGALLGAAVELRGGRAARRADGAFFTAPDVSRWLAERVICARLLDDVLELERLDALLADNESMLDAVARVAAGSRAQREVLLGRLASLTVLDPTCGAGAFLVAAWEVLLELAERLGAPPSCAAQLIGIDRDRPTVEACRANLQLVTGSDDARVRCADALATNVPPCDVVLGNPPYVRAAASAAPVGAATGAVGNVAAWVLERTIRAAAPGARIGVVLPISFACTSGWEPMRQVWRTATDRSAMTHFDAIPSALFPDAVQRVTLLEGRVAGPSNAPRRAWTSRYHRWLREEREGLLERVRQVPEPALGVSGSVAKIGTGVEATLLDRLSRHEAAGRWLCDPQRAAGNVVHYKRRWSYFLLFTDTVPRIWDGDGVERAPTECKTAHVVPELDSRVLLAIWSSSLFWWYFSVFTDNRNVNVRDLAAFPVPELSEKLRGRLVALAQAYLARLHEHSEVRSCTYRSIGTIHNTYFRQGPTRPILDRIDTVLAEAYGMAPEELEFVIGFERRFRS